MAVLIQAPVVIRAAGTPPKKIQEFIGRVSSSTSDTSVARMISPQGWSEPGQTPDFDEYTIVLKGALMAETRQDSHIIREGQALIAPQGEWIRYSTPFDGGAEYISVCIPAFSGDTVHRDTD
jgi:mannose-6-phosphate isomerase-like protein (cupin superfamily)